MMEHLPKQVFCYPTKINKFMEQVIKISELSRSSSEEEYKQPKQENKIEKFTNLNTTSNNKLTLWIVLLILLLVIVFKLLK